MPSTLHEILGVLSGDLTIPDLKRLQAIISRDPSVTAYVLRRVNSSFYGLPRRIATVEQAVTLLGYYHTSNLVLIVGLKQAFVYLEGKRERNIFGHIITTSVSAAAYARELTHFLLLPFAETAFTAGILHQLGRLVLLYSYATPYAALWYRDDRLASPSAEEERGLFKTDFAAYGGATAEQWGLPPEIITPLRYQLSPEVVADPALRTLTLTVSAAHTLATRLFSQDDDERLPLPLADLARAQGQDFAGLAAFLKQRRSAIRDYGHSVLYG